MLQRLVASCCQLAINKRVPTSSASYAERLTAAISGYAWRDNLKNSRRGGRPRQEDLSQPVVHWSVTDYIYLRCGLDDLLDDKRLVLKKHERASEIHRKNLTIFSISAQRVSVEEGLELRRRRLVRNVGRGQRVFIYTTVEEKWERPIFGKRVPGQGAVQVTEGRIATFHLYQSCGYMPNSAYQR